VTKDENLFEDIVTNRLCLRCLRPGDAEEMFAYRSDPLVLKFQSWAPQSLEEVHSFIKNVMERDFNAIGWYQIGIALRADGALIGDCGIHILEADTRIVEIGITISPVFQSKGYATEALNAVLDLLFVKLEKHRVFASVDPLNTPSMALMKRIGLRKEGHFLQSLWFKDGWVDDVVFAMLASEWHSKRRSGV
jgi:RimJ/RimL family protein N-acetyltransferase